MSSFIFRGTLVDSLFLVLFSEKKWVGRSETEKEKERENFFKLASRERFYGRSDTRIHDYVQMTI